MIDVKYWISEFLKHFLETGLVANMADGYGVAVLPTDEPAAPQYRVAGIRHLSGTENNGNHHAYIDVIDTDGLRLWNTMVGVHQHGVGQFFARVDKPAHEPGCNHVLNLNVSNNTIFISEAGYQSERVTGLKSDHPDEGPGNTRGHHSFYMVFVRLDRPLEITPPTEPEPPVVTPPAGNDEALLAIHRLLELVLQNQAAQGLALKRIEDLLSGRHINPAMARMLHTELGRLVDQFGNLLDG